MDTCKMGYALNKDGTIPERCNVDWDDGFYPTVCKECPSYSCGNEEAVMDDVIKNLYTLFDAAFEENMNGRGTDITRMVTTFVPDAIQNLQAYEIMFNVKEAEWVYDHWCEFKCSNCGNWSDSKPHKGKEKYCPECGAKMKNT